MGGKSLRRNCASIRASSSVNVVGGTQCGQHDDGQVISILLPKAATEVDSRKARHTDVEDGEVDCAVLQLLPGLVAVGDLEGVISAVGKSATHEVADRSLVVGNKNPFHCYSIYAVCAASGARHPNSNMVIMSILFIR